jgi:hypothetical protein
MRCFCFCYLLVLVRCTWTQARFFRLALGGGESFAFARHIAVPNIVNMFDQVIGTSSQLEWWSTEDIQKKCGN